LKFGLATAFLVIICLIGSLGYYGSYNNINDSIITSYTSPKRNMELIESKLMNTNDLKDLVVEIKLNDRDSSFSNDTKKNSADINEKEYENYQEQEQVTSELIIKEDKNTKALVSSKPVENKKIKMYIIQTLTIKMLSKAILTY